LGCDIRECPPTPFAPIMLLSARAARTLVLTGIVLSASSAHAQNIGPTNAPAARPSLVVFVTVDQMRSDYFQRFDKQLTGGLRRLFDGGAFFLDGFQDHAITETAPGHASTMSGRFPVHTGIMMNSQGVNDVPNAELIGAPSDPGASPERFRGTTLTDWIRARNPDMRVLSVSRKDRGAILPIGRSRTNVFWWAPSNATFTTSRYYADSLPGWVQRFNARHMGQQYAGKEWDLLLPESAYPEADSVPAENRGQAFTFPHLVSEDSTIAARSAAAYPWMDGMTLAFALDGVNTLGLGTSTDRTDLLAVSLSTTDAVGHAYGPDSREMHDQILRLDRQLGVFLDSLYKLRDGRRIVVALTGDHGMTPFPAIKSTIYPNHDAKVVSIREPFHEFRQRLAVAGVDSTAVTLEQDLVLLTNLDAFAKAHVNPDSAIRSFIPDLMRVPGVLRADMMTALAKADTTHDTIARRWLHMFGPNTIVRMVVTLTPFSYWAPASYPTHGSPHDDDAHVPILFYGAGVKPGKYSGFVRVVDMAPTLAALVGVTPLEVIDGRVLTRAIK
jgi:predicted AlkP superfamily pyrophosphatase or phosphodiesterase